MFREGLTKKERAKAKKILDSLRKKDKKFLKHCLAQQKTNIVYIDTSVKDDDDRATFGPGVRDD